MSVRPIPEGYHTVTPYLVVPGVAGVLEFVKQAFGATERHRVADPTGRIAHAEVRIGDSIVMLGEPPAGTPPIPGFIHLYVHDVDATYQRALAAGGHSIREPRNEFYGDRSAGVKDAAGNTWWIATHVEDVSDEEVRRRAAAAK